MTVSFKNFGKIDPRCITTIGVSVKETENPIGFFGTGLKYAIAIILRNGGAVTIWSGLEHFNFTTKSVSIRGETMELVCMNGQELGFTTQLGKTWKVWQALREIYCNTLDENGVSQIGEISPCEDHTVIMVDLDEFTDCYRDIGKYILQSNSIIEGNYISFHDNMSHHVFYKTISVIDVWDSKPFFFTPNIQSKIDLTEDRTAKDHWQIKRLLAEAILECEDKEFLEKWLTVGPDYAEYTVDLDWSHIPSQEFLSVVSKLALDTSRKINLTALKVLSKHRIVPDPVEAELMEVEREALNKAIAFCRSLTYQVDEFPIVIVESLGENILGKADIDSRRIFLARRSILLGDMTLASTLIEEWVHIKHGFRDCERNMQNWLFEQLTRLGAAFLHNKKCDHSS
jgi:hypothetical protein